MAAKDAGKGRFGLIAKRAANTAKAFEALNKVLSGPGSDSDKELAAGKVLEMTNDFAGAVEWYQRALNVRGTGPEARARLVLVELKRCNTEVALLHARALADLHPDFSFRSLGGTTISTFTVLGDALLASDRTPEAFEAYKSALELQPTDGYAAGQLAKLHLDAGRLDAAAELARIDTVTHSRFDGVVAAARLTARDAAGPAIRVAGLLAEPSPA